MSFSCPPLFLLCSSSAPSLLLLCSFSRLSLLLLCSSLRLSAPSPFLCSTLLLSFLCSALLFPFLSCFAPFLSCAQPCSFRFLCSALLLSCLVLCFVPLSLSAPSQLFLCLCLSKKVATKAAWLRKNDKNRPRRHGSNGTFSGRETTAGAPAGQGRRSGPRGPLTSSPGGIWTTNPKKNRQPSW